MCESDVYSERPQSVYPGPTATETSPRRRTNRRGLPLLRAALFSILALTAQGQSDEEGRARNQPTAPFRIIGNIHYVGASDVTSFLITTPAGHILLDGGYKETAPQIKANIATLGFRLADVKILLNSHAHADHAGGLAELKKGTGAQLMVMEDDAELLARGGKGDFAFGDKLTYPPATADRVLHDGDKVELGGTTLIAHLTPGHTKGCTTWTTTVHEGGREYAVVFVGSVSAPGYKLLRNPQYPTIKDDYARAFAVLKALPCDVFLGSHGIFFSLAEKAKRRTAAGATNPFIDPEGYRRFLEKSERNLQEQLAREKKATP